jgi:hypothetical protein
VIGLLCFALAVLASPLKSKLRLAAENAVLRHQLSLVSFNPEGSHNHSTRVARALAQGRLSLLLALEIV